MIVCYCSSCSYSVGHWFWNSNISLYCEIAFSVNDITLYGCTVHFSETKSAYMHCLVVAQMTTSYTPQNWPELLLNLTDTISLMHLYSSRPILGKYSNTTHSVMHNFGWSIICDFTRDKHPADNIFTIIADKYPIYLIEQDYHFNTRFMALQKNSNAWIFETVRLAATQAGLYRSVMHTEWFVISTIGSHIGFFGFLFHYIKLFRLNWWSQLSI